MNSLQTAWWIAKGVGLDNVPRRIRQSLLTRSGLLNRAMDPRRYTTSHLATRTCSDAEIQSAWRDRATRFLHVPTEQELQGLVSEAVWNKYVARICQKGLEGQYPFFSRWFAPLGWPPNFNRDPVNEIDWPVGDLWPRHTRSGPPRNDIKLVWEPSRFTLAYYLARHYRCTGDDRWASAFWEMFDAWVVQNPVNQSVAWGCGQEIAFRLMAMLTGAISTVESPFATPQRLRILEQLCWQFGKRIAANINYALSQKNNHGISEAAGLWTIGVLFPQFPEASRWQRRAAKILDAEVRRQIYDDGSYIQHSFSYHRVMLDDLMWVICLAKRNGISMSSTLKDRFCRATEWLAQFVDEKTGRVPNIGTNDGANVLPLACCDYLDYRPTLEAASSVAELANPLAESGSWSEKTLWLTGRTAKPNPATVPRPSIWSAPIGGYHVLRGPSSHAVLRAVDYRDRPGQCDMLHLDLWYHGENVLRDAGSYRYYHEDAEVKAYFSSVEAHNTLQVEGRSQMEKGPRFLWFDWPKVTTKMRSDQECAAEASYRSGPLRWRHARQVCRDGDNYTVQDRYGGGDQFVVRWRLTPDLDWEEIQPNQFRAQFQSGTIDLEVRADGEFQCSLVSAWESLYYGERTQLPVLEIRGQAESITTFIRLGGSSAQEREDPTSRS